MKLRTSYFNATVLRKDITRFAPVWGLYTVFLLLYMMLLSPGPYPGTKAESISNHLSGMAWINLIYAGISAAMLFGDLCNSRMCNALHAMPLRREGWFLTHTLAGLLFSIIPNLICALIATITLLRQYFFMALIWLAVSLLQYLFFFGAATFSAMCGGNRVGMVSIYGIINFLAGIIYWLSILFFEPLLYGIQMESGIYILFMPAIFITGIEYVVFDYKKFTDSWIWGGFIAESWNYLFAVAAIGLVFLAVSLLIYRRRKLESAGDFISLRPCAPVFLVIYTLTAAAFLYGLADSFGNDLTYLFLAVGLFVGFFTGKMLLNKTVRVFQLKTFLQFLLLCAVMIGSIILTWLDPLGITRYVPDTEDIRSMQVYNSADLYTYPQDSPSFTITDRSEIDTYRDLHQKLIDDREAGTRYSLCDVQIRYQLTNGATVTRYYSVPKNSTLAPRLQTYFSNWRYVFQTDNWDSLTGSVTYVTIDRYYNDNKDGNNHENYALKEHSEILQLLEAVKQDCQAGTMAQDWDFHQHVETEGWLGLELSYEGTAYRLDLTVYSDCANTLAFLNSYNPAN